MPYSRWQKNKGEGGGGCQGGEELFHSDMVVRDSPVEVGALSKDVKELSKQTMWVWGEESSRQREQRAKALGEVCLTS